MSARHLAVGIPYVAAQSALYLPDDALWPWLLARIETATRSIRVATFILDPSPEADAQRSVRDALDALAEAAERGVDVRLVVDRATPHSEIAIRNRAAVRYAQGRGIDARSVTPAFDTSLHSKFAVFDREIVVVGSHNWSGRAFTASAEDSIAVRSPDLALLLSAHFDAMWQSGDAR